ncbi:MAG: GNAT family N-acetyltransferase [Candidatus Coprovivens sp.]
MITIKENIDNVEEYNYLFDEVGWGAHDYEISKIALKSNTYSVSVYDNNKIIGYGRIIGDGIIYLHIHDIMVHPNYQNKGIGKQIINKLLEKVNELKKVNPYLRVYLGTSQGKEDFYKKCGFITREEAKLGQGMILK